MATQAVCAQSQPSGTAEVNSRPRRMGIDTCFDNEELTRNVHAAAGMGARPGWVGTSAANQSWVWGLRSDG